MIVLEYVTVEDGTVLDRITSDGGTAAYETGLARPVVEGLAHRVGTEAAAIELLSDGWSNGYVTIRRAT